MDQKTVAIQLRKLASDPDNQTYIVREKGCMKGLLGFLDSDDETVVLISLQSLQFLSAHPMNREALLKERGLLAKVTNMADSDNQNVARVAAMILENLETAVNGATLRRPSETKIPATSTATTTATATPSKQSAFMPRYLYTIALKIDDLKSKEDSEVVEKALLSVTGVVSVSVELSRQRVIVYTRLKEAEAHSKLLAATKQCGFGASIDVPSGNPENSPPSCSAPPSSATPLAVSASSLSSGNVERSSTAAAAASASASVPAIGKENASRATNGDPLGPQYLTSTKLRGAKGDALVEYAGIRQSSLEARLKKQQEQQQEQDQRQSGIRSFLGAVTSYFW